MRASSLSDASQPAARVFGIGVAVLGACLLLPATAAADPAKAESLFREGRRLLADGQLVAACEKFSESQREEPSSGTLLNLARCHGDAGLTATAWAEYLAAARLARAQARPQQAAEAELRASELEPLLVRMLVQLDAPAQGIVVTRDEKPLGVADLGQPLAVDPGRHVLRAVAPGYAEWTTSVLLTEPGELRSVRIPALVPLAPSPQPAARQPATQATPAESSSAAAKPDRTTGAVVASEPRRIPPATWVAAGVGTAALASSAVLAWIAKSKWDDAHDRGLCDASHSCNQEGLSQTDQARRLGNVATGCAVVGVAAFASAFLFYSFDTPSSKTPVRVGVAFDRASAALGLQGGF
jgi:hypothetical protein